ncbi:6-phosphogluconolactonase [Sphingomonas sp. PP-CE-3A-406]|uniref:lactonase family protein n=1 Tax=Sphingomonas sp. PP-CE-3A-406 TaxID=2135659 RepID=UPI000EF8AF59|nr:lactonase family protein [Sphingomonas sp. PP-CE-3A-406]RMB55524.1 6-phosphogluconolactonase [Sphingomonas sp. PP-CE-3A-406]
MTDWTMTRRSALTAMAATIAVPAAAKRSVRLIAGTYSREGGKGLYPIGYDPDRDRWQVEAPIPRIDDASFGVGGGPGGAYYLVREQTQGEISAYAPGWTKRGTAPTKGADPCYVALDRASGCLAIANYSSGGVAFHRLDPRTGVPGDPVLFDHVGKGPNTARQEGPHAHWVGFSPDRRWLHSIDLGTDTLYAYRFDATARTLARPVAAWHADSGAGPRHLVHHQRLPRAYVVCELSNTLVTLDAGADGRFVTRSRLSTLPVGYRGASQAAHIAIDPTGRRLYVSNRGQNGIAVFALDAAGVPTLLQHIASGGDWPRFFLLLDDARRMVVANERSATLAIFAIGPDGRLSATGKQLAVPGAVFLGRL